MNIILKNSCKEVRKYILEVNNNVSCVDAWEKEVIAPFWSDLCKYAPFDLSNRKPKPITNLNLLEQICDGLEKLDMAFIQNEFDKIVNLLPNYDDDPITIVIFPCDPDNKKVNEKQNGVLGCSTFGNLFIQVNSLIDGYEKWIPYVFAHEYHHTVYGNYWMMMHSSDLTNQFYESLICDGEADSFALSIYKELKPVWLFDMTKEEISALWTQSYKDIVFSKDVDYGAFMFGSKSKNIPFCGGYKIGYWIVQDYIQKNQLDIKDILETNPVKLINSFVNNE